MVSSHQIGRIPPVPPRSGDFHMHSTASDGSWSPTEVIERAGELRIATVSLTDHDTVAGVAEAMEAGVRYGVEVIPGCEFSTMWRGRDIHVLGLFIDSEHSGILEFGEKLRVNRFERATKIVEKLEHMGAAINFEMMLSDANGALLGRPHIAAALIKAGHATAMDDAFARFIGSGCEGFMPKAAPPCSEVIALIHNAGGIAIVAHPLVTFKVRDDLDAFLYEHSTKSKRKSDGISESGNRGLANSAIDGLEVLHPGHSTEGRDFLAAIVQNRGLLASGGSDCHGPGLNRVARGGGDPSTGRMGSVWVDEEWVEILKDSVT